MNLENPNADVFPFNLFDNERDIKQWLDLHKIKDYTIHEDLSVTALSDVGIYHPGLIFLPLYFREAKGDFNVINSNLITLRGCPSIVLGSFNCSRNALTTLDGGPSFVKGSYSCFQNKLTNLIGMGSVGRGIQVSDNQLESFKGIPSVVGGSLRAINNHITSLISLPQRVEGASIELTDNPILSIYKNELPEYFQEIIISHPKHLHIKGFEDFYEHDFLVLSQEDLLTILLKHEMDNKLGESGGVSVRKKI